MEEQRRTYKVGPISVNGAKIVQVVIDPHYEAKHRGSVNDGLIVELVRQLDGRRELPEARLGRYSYFATLIELKSKQYRLIWLPEDHAIYVGVVNVYRDRRRS